jgi:hypothetical protein
MRRFWTKRASDVPTWMEPPPSGPLRFDPSVRTASELVNGDGHLAGHEVTHVAA